MRNQAMTRLLVLAVMTALAATATADTLKNTPGYVDLEWIKIPGDAREVQDIDLGAVLLGIAADAKENQDEAFLQALGMIKSIRVKSWSLEGDDPATAKAVAKLEDKLAKDEWKRLIYSKDGDETVTVSTRYEGKNMVGLMLITYEPDDSVAFVNVVGDLDLPTLLSLVQEFDEGSITEMLAEFEGAQEEAGQEEAGQED